MKRSRTCKCGKRRFRDHHEAIGALHAIANNASPGARHPVRCYCCLMCSGWHLTSSP